MCNSIHRLATHDRKAFVAINSNRVILWPVLRQRDNHKGHKGHKEFFVLFVSLWFKSEE